jgi:serine beta-lactamase-like protein LACTB
VSHLAGIRHYVKKDEPEVEQSSPEENSKEDKDKKSTRQIEVYNKEKFDSIEKALKMFQDDELLSEPGTKFLYTTHGWTLVGIYIYIRM